MSSTCATPSFEGMTIIGSDSSVSTCGSLEELIWSEFPIPNPLRKLVMPLKLGELLVLVAVLAGVSL